MLSLIFSTLLGKYLIERLDRLSQWLMVDKIYANDCLAVHHPFGAILYWKMTEPFLQCKVDI